MDMVIRLFVAAVFAFSTSANAARIQLSQPPGTGGGGGGDPACELTGGADCVMTGPIQASDGTSALPSYTFASDTNTGIVWVSADSFAFTLGSTNRLTLSTTTMTHLIQSVYSGVSIDITSADAEDLVLQAGTTGATAVSTSFQRGWTLARNAAGNQQVFTISPDTSIADSEIGRSIGSGGTGTSHFSCGTGSPCAQIRATGTGYASLHIASPSGTATGHASLWFESSGATNDREMWAIEQLSDRLVLRNYDEDSWVSGGNLTALEWLETGPIRPYNHTAAATVTAPVTCAAGVAGAMAYFDDSDDSAPGEMCFCTKLDNTASFAWRKIADPAVSCFGL